MGCIKLVLQVPQHSTGEMLLVDPDPYWTIDSLISELNSFQIKSPLPPPSSSLSLSKSEYRRDTRLEEKASISNGKSFIMRINDDDMEEVEDTEGSNAQSLKLGSCFSCPEAYFSDEEDSDYELGSDQYHSKLMNKKGLAECFLFELERENQLKIMSDIRKNVHALEAELRNENKRLLSAIHQHEKHTEARRELDKQIDKQYRRKVAETLDRHLSMVQRDHEQRSQIEEQRIKVDAAFEEAKRKERALLEEKMFREKEEAEARKEADRMAEEKRIAAMEAAKVAAAKPQVNDDSKTQETVPERKLETNILDNRQSPEKRDAVLPPTSPPFVLKLADSAQRAAAELIEKHDKGSELYDKLVSCSDKDFESYQRQIARRIRQLTGTIENVRTKSTELSGIMKDPRCPYPVSLMIFAKKILGLCENPGASFDSIAFAVGHVIVRVTEQVPDTMDFVLAEFHKACIYTVPKYIQLTKMTNSNKEYQKLIGYREENGVIENTDAYLDRIESYMKLYAALVQTEIGTKPNPHGMKEGWAWLARFLNVLPPNRHTAVALEAFLKMAGFALFQKYKIQFIKIINVIFRKFLPALKARGGSNVTISKLETYLEKKLYLTEPNGRRLEASLSSRLHMA